jgi:hypothetical protein
MQRKRDETHAVDDLDQIGRLVHSDSVNDQIGLHVRTTRYSAGEGICELRKSVGESCGRGGGGGGQGSVGEGTGRYAKGSRTVSTLPTDQEGSRGLTVAQT